MPIPDEKPAHDPADDLTMPVDDVLEYADHCEKQAGDVSDVAAKFGDDLRIGSRNFLTWVEAMQTTFATAGVAVALGPLAPVAFALEAHYAGEYKKTVYDFAKKYETARWKTEERIAAISDAVEILGLTVEEVAKNTANADETNSDHIGGSVKGD